MVDEAQKKAKKAAEHSPYHSYCSCAVINLSCVSGWDTKDESVVKSINTSISIRRVSSDTILFNYETPDKNIPSLYGDRVFLFQHAYPDFESGDKPLATHKIRNANAKGMEALSYTTTANTTYCLCYAKGGRIEDICAYVTFKTL